MSKLDNPADMVSVPIVQSDKPVDWEQVKALHFSDQQYFLNLEADSVRDPNTGRLLKSPIGADWDPKLDPDKQTKVRFTRERVFSKCETAKAGEPTYIIQEFITILPPRVNAEGKPVSKDYTTVHTPMTPFYEWRFKKEYDAWKAGKETFVGTTLLAHWSKIQAHADVIEEMSLIGIRTVEDLVSTSDYAGSAHVKNFSHWKQLARDFIGEKNKPQEVIELEQKFAEQQKQIDQLLALLAKQQAEQQSTVRAKGSDGKFQKRNTDESAE